MPLTEYKKDDEDLPAFIFRGNDILIRKEDSLPCEKRLPDGQLFSRLTGSYTNLFTEREYGYSAMMLDGESQGAEGWIFIPLREFFWISKSESEQLSGLPSRLGSLAARAHGFLSLLATYKFCPRCGSALSFDTKETAMRCSNPGCGRLDFPHIEPAVIVLVSRRQGADQEILLVKNRNSKGNFYGCVSGFVEMGERIEDAAVREVMEETGIAIKNLRYVGSQSWPFPDQLMFAFTADYEAGEITMQEEELLDAGWFHRNALPEIPRPGSVAYNLITGNFTPS
ncbi:MAG: NAD(+) diphosphatase [Treponema sp.]|nr:NAD(+) diphosphatase [Treponema sp.]